MDNVDNILKKILLNMRYDSRKTLKENKLLLEEKKQYALAWDGRTLELPLNAVINGYNNHSKFISKSVSDLETNFPLWSEACKIHKPNEYGKCLNDYKIKWNSIVKDGSVRAFKIDGKQYYQCYIVHVPDKINYPALGTPANMKMAGYSDNCVSGRFWTAYSKNPPNPPPKNPDGDNTPTGSADLEVANQACKTNAETELSKAVSFWKNWLNNPITRKKVEKNWIDEANFIEIYSGYHRVSSNYAWSKYFDILNNLNLIFYDDTMPNANINAYAYVRPSKSLYDININCSSYEIELLETLVHEIQHLLYHVKPLNPTKKISNAFVNKNKKIETMANIFDINKLEVPNIDKLKTSKDPKIMETSKKLNIDYFYLEIWKKESLNPPDDNPDYYCSEKEKMSNIFAVRSLFGIKPGGKITLNMLMPYIKRKKNHADIDFIILCWAQQDFPDINGMLDHVNKLAFNQDNEKPKIGDLPKPNFS
jgi:hypothetical protein